MADEARVNSGLYITADNLYYKSLPVNFTADVTGRKGPTPGALTIPVGGKEISLQELTVPGLCRVVNYDTANYVMLGVYLRALHLFVPFMRLLAGESYVFRLDAAFGEEYVGTGTGTTADDVVSLFAKANGGNVNITVDAFEA